MPDRLYPLELSGRAKETCWGSPEIGKYIEGRIEPSQCIGEVWSAFDGAKGSRVANGAYAGRSISEMMTFWGLSLLGSQGARYGKGRFPLLVKILGAADRLSVQVHPGDEYAADREEGQLGKTEAWHILESRPESEIFVGFKRPTDREEVRQAVEDKTIGELLNSIHPSAGEIFHIPAGRVHSIGAGVILAEVQQNSDLTYRLYDWDRLVDGQSRELHLEKALDVLDFSADNGESRIRTLEARVDGVPATYLNVCRYFASRLRGFAKATRLTPPRRSFSILTGIRGQARVEAGGVEAWVRPGGSVILPAGLPYAYVAPDAGRECAMLESFVPDLQGDVIEPLLAEGLDLEQIVALGGPGESNDLAVFAGAGRKRP